MEIIFNCPNCDQELAVDSEGAGEEIKCPTCGEKITIPDKPKGAPPPPPPPPHASGEHPINPIASSAAAKVEMRLKVPVRNQPTESLIKKAAVPLEAVAKGHDKQIRTHTIRHSACFEAGHDKFDEITSKFLGAVGEANLIGVHAINYEHFDVQTQKVMVDFGLLVIYRG